MSKNRNWTCNLVVHFICLVLLLLSAKIAMAAWIFWPPPDGTQPGQSAARPANNALPFSFEYGGRWSDTLLPFWKQSSKTIKVADGKQQVFTWDDPKTGLRVAWSVMRYSKYDAAEMRLSFENRGKERSETLRNVRVIRRAFTGPVDVVHETGGYGAWQLNADDLKGLPGNFAPAVARLASAGDKLSLSALDGWSSNKDLPFWMVLQPDGSGFYYGLGWTGQWAADFATSRDNTVELEAGMDYLNLRLEPGEKISQPSVLAGRFTGGREAGGNALRRILYRQYIATLGGKKPLPPVSWNHYFTFANDINEQKMLSLVDGVAGLGIEYFCVDAGWYNVEFWQSGDWRPNPTKFPNGLEPVARAVKAKGMKMGLWFDPERVTDKAYDAFPHKEFLLKATSGPAALENGVKVWLVDLSRPDARKWMIDLITDYARRLDLGWIRWDMNYPPLEMWRMASEKNPDREGVEEIRYVEGLYQVLDGIRKNCPNLVIEWCAGGGRRIDLESLRRCHTLWKSDITGDGDITRPHLTGGNEFLPGNLLNSNLIKLESIYDYHCQFGGPLGFGHDFRSDSPEKTALARQTIASYKGLRRFLVEDYYPLFGYTTDLTKWDGWQFHDPKKNEGFFLAFRPEKSATDTNVIKLRGLDPVKTYVLATDSAGSVPETATGKMLRNGLAVQLKTPRSSLLVRYHLK